VIRTGVDYAGTSTRPLADSNLFGRLVGPRFELADDLMDSCLDGRGAYFEIARDRGGRIAFHEKFKDLLLASR
jgi:hypothetical protein